MALTDKLTTIANAIRSKTGKSDALTLDQMATEIESISAGGGDETENPVVALLDGSITEIASNAEDIEAIYIVAGQSALERVTFPNLKNIRSYAFASANLSNKHSYEGYFPECTTIGSNAFSSDNGYGTFLKRAIFPKVQTVYTKAFYKNHLLEEVYFPECTTIQESAFGSNQGSNKVKTAAFPKLMTCERRALGNWSSIKLLDLASATNIYSYAFQSNYSMIAVILRNPSLCTISNTDGFTSCYHYEGTVNSTYNPDGLKDGYIYVPSALIEEYKAATNWSTFAEQFRALEDYTVDGTTTGELDLAKMGVEL